MFKLQTPEFKIEADDRIDDAVSIARHLLKIDGAIHTTEAQLNNDVRWVYVLEGKIRAIKLYRDRKGCALLEAKQYVEQLCFDLMSPSQNEEHRQNLETDVRYYSDLANNLKDEIRALENQLARVQGELNDCQDAH